MTPNSEAVLSAAWAMAATPGNDPGRVQKIVDDIALSLHQALLQSFVKANYRYRITIVDRDYGHQWIKDGQTDDDRKAYTRADLETLRDIEAVRQEAARAKREQEWLVAKKVQREAQEAVQREHYERVKRLEAEAKEAQARLNRERNALPNRTDDSEF